MSDLATLNRTVQIASATTDFNHLARAYALTGGNPRETEKFLTLTGASSPRLRDIFQIKAAFQSKTGVDTGTLGGTTWGSTAAGYRQISSGFVQTLPAYSAFERILSDRAFVSVPLRTQFAVASSGATANTISELAATPISAMTFASGQLDAVKGVGEVVYTKELMASMDPLTVENFGNELRQSVAKAVDEKFMALVAATGSIATHATTGVTASAFLADVALALHTINVSKQSRLYLILPPKIAKTVSLLRDGGYLIGGGMMGDSIKVIASDAATTTGMLIDAAQIAGVDDGVELNSGDHACVELDTNPTSGAKELVSLWQNGYRALRCIRYFGCQVLRSNAASLITGYSTT